MRNLMPEVKYLEKSENYTRKFSGFVLSSEHCDVKHARELLCMKMWNYPELMGREEPIGLVWKPLDACEGGIHEESELLSKQGYCLEVKEDEICVYADTDAGFLNALSTIKQLLEKRDGYYLPQVLIRDWPSIEYRSISTTFAWYAGYGRYGFDMQLWGMEEWKQFLNICSDYKINQLNLCLYGYWPFKMKEYPEAECRGLRMKLWNPESENWIEVEYMHPNLAEEFLPQLIEYGHQLGIYFYAYIGLNSYSGGYSNVYREKRMKMPENSRFINDFDSLCLSDETTITYLKKSMREIVAQGFDGIDFEESEEAFWYCNCDKCRERFWKNASTPEETLHAANTYLLDILYKELKAAKPDITIGIRAWRQPPLVRGEELMQEMKNSIPDDVVLFWAPGQYVEDSEFEKWIQVFGKERIRARDTEAIGFAAGLGRLIRPCRFNGLRTEEEPITQYIEEDIRQHRGSVRMGVAGINGYLFEWYGFFMALFAHSYFGWGCQRETDEFFDYALEAVFGDMADDISYVMHHMLTIHESQLNIFELEFPFAKNKVEKRDIPRIQRAIEEYPLLLEKLDRVIKRLRADEHNAHFALHFKKWKVSLERSRVIYDLALESLELADAQTEEEKQRILDKMYMDNEREFAIIRENYFDVNPVRETGVASCMIPYHELKRCIWNLRYPEQKIEEPVYLGVESLGWMWF